MDNKLLHILWTNADPVTSELMVLMYARNSMIHGFWEDVTVIIWGATTKLVAEDENIQLLIKNSMNAGVKFTACKACVDELDVSDKFHELGIEVIYWGVPLTEIIKSKGNLITI